MVADHPVPARGGVEPGEHVVVVVVAVDEQPPHASLCAAGVEVVEGVDVVLVMFEESEVAELDDDVDVEPPGEVDEPEAPFDVAVGVTGEQDVAAFPSFEFVERGCCGHVCHCVGSFSGSSSSAVAVADSSGAALFDRTGHGSTMVLTGSEAKVDTYVSAAPFKRGTRPIVHMSVGCLSRSKLSVAETAAGVVNRFESVSAASATRIELARMAEVRPCRVCALPHVFDVLVTSSRQAPARERRLVCVTSLPAPDVDLGRLAGAKVSDSGRDRLERMAARAAVEVADTTLGPVAMLSLTEADTAALSRSLWSLPAPKRFNTSRFDVSAVSMLANLVLASGLMSPSYAMWRDVERLCRPLR